MALTEREKAILDFERGWWTEDGVKDVMPVSGSVARPMSTTPT